MMNEQQLRNWICEIGRRLYTKNLAVATDGNISVRLDSERFLCTASGVSLGFMRPDDIVIADGHGNKVAGTYQVTSEFYTHLAAYEQRPDRSAVVHAHPTYATALTMMGVDTQRPLLPELVMNLVALPVAPYAMPGCAEGAHAVRELIRDYDAVLLDRHGAIVVGKDLREAFLMMERVEHAAQILYLAYALGDPQALPSHRVEKLMAATVPPGAPVPPYPFAGPEPENNETG